MGSTPKSCKSTKADKMHIYIQIISILLGYARKYPDPLRPNSRSSHLHMKRIFIISESYLTILLAFFYLINFGVLTPWGYPNCPKGPRGSGSSDPKCMIFTLKTYQTTFIHKQELKLVFRWMKDRQKRTEGQTDVKVEIIIQILASSLFTYLNKEFSNESLC